MPRKALKYVNTYVDRTGTLRSYFRRAGEPRVALPGLPGSPVFMSAYKMLIAPKPKPMVARPRRVKSKKPPIGQIYYLSDGDHIKIGFTLNWNKRKYAYGTYSPRDLELIAIHRGTMFDEKRLHRMFKQHRVKNEWYSRSPEIMAHIKRTMDELNDCLTLPRLGSAGEIHQ